MVIKGMNSIGDDSYFIRLKDNKENYIHFGGDNPSNPKEEVAYVVKKGLIGACGFHKVQGENFIKMSGADNLELVKMSDVVKDDGTSN